MKVKLLKFINRDLLYTHWNQFFELYIESLIMSLKLNRNPWGYFQNFWEICCKCLLEICLSKTCLWLLFCLSLLLKFDELGYFFISFDCIVVALYRIIYKNKFSWLMIYNLNTGFGSNLWYHQMLMNKYDMDLTIKNTLDVKLMHLDILFCIPIPYMILW